ncbi:FtsX-like permease family protein [Methanogenium sp. S4BF]|uniref:ABC transporter permease n=1 Tax=Methanogenium sp. S4BF TaxID=1789226 RepID=UPI002415A46A|nr:FtsX-like permease family protein [Methanogenium sp. S4BF]WFN34634.1 FtsX-like permease family protein [Methanogenium sp. S4BF]
MFDDLRVSAFLAARSIQRGGSGRNAMNIIIIALVLTNMIFLPSVIMGAMDVYYVQTVDYISSDVIIKPPEDIRYIDDVETLLATVNRVPGVVRASARYPMAGSIDFEDKTVAMQIDAFDPRDETEVTLFHKHVKEGDFLGSGDRDQILVGSLVAGTKDDTGEFYASLGGATVGDSVVVRYANGVVREYRIKGIFTTKSYQADYMVFVTKDEMDAVTGLGGAQATEVLVKTVANEDAPLVKKRILQFGVGEDVETWEEALPDVVSESVESFAIINMISVLGSLVIAVVLIFIMTTIKTFNNRKQIGILKAIGLKKSIIINSYVMQVIFICLIGAIVGSILIGTMVLYFTTYPIEFPDGDVTPIVTWTMIVENTALLFISSAVAGFIPAWRVTNEGILEAIRGG